MEELLTLLRDYYDAAKIGAAMEDSTDYEVHDYDRMMRELMQRTEKLLPDLVEPRCAVQNFVL